jgi:ADP-ribosyl-[dinitrogen reductase] hydrolase
MAGVLSPITRKYRVPLNIVRGTHGAPAAVDACKFYAALILGALGGASKEELLGPDFYTGSLVPEIAEVAAGRLSRRTRPKSLAAATLCARLKPRSGRSTAQARSKKGALLAANLGDDADTTAAIFGQLAGAFYGESEIPPSWIQKLAMREFICEMADALLNLSQTASQNRVSPVTAAATEAGIAFQRVR